jgi:hypothetical protein
MALFALPPVWISLYQHIIFNIIHDFNHNLFIPYSYLLIKHLAFQCLFRRTQPTELPHSLRRWLFQWFIRFEYIPTIFILHTNSKINHNN